MCSPFVSLLSLCSLASSLLWLPPSLLLRSFNKLTYISPDVCSMGLLEDLRLWGNKLTDIPGPILYADVKKIVGYIRATERERFIIANQIRALQGPRSSSRISMLKATPAVSLNRAHSATRALSQREDRRFAPLGFYDDRDADAPDGQPLMPASSRSVGSGMGFGNARTGSTRRVGGGGDSGSEAEDMGSDDEFTSMFRAVTSRTGSFTNLAGGGQFAGGGAGGGGGAAASTEHGSRVSSGGSSRRSNQTVSRSPVPPLHSGPSPSLPNQHHSSTIVQPFQSHGSFSLGISAISSSGGGGGGGGSALGLSGSKPNASPAHTRRGSNAVPGLQSIHDTPHDRYDDSDVDADADGEVDLSPKGENLTDLVRRDWKPISSALPDLQPTAAAKSAPERSASPGTVSSHHDQNDSVDLTLSTVDPALMEEWDMQSQAIENEKQQQMGKGERKKKVGKAAAGGW